VTEPGCRLGTHQSRRVWSGGQGVEETVGGALKIAKLDASIEGPKDVSVSGKTSKDAAARRGMEGAFEKDVIGHITMTTSRTRPLMSGK